MKYRMLDKKNLILIAAGVAALSIMYFSLIRPQEAELRRLQQEIQDKEVLYVKLEVLSQLVDELREEKETVGQTIDRYLKTREIGGEGLVIPESIINILRESRADVVSIRPNPERVEGDLLIASWDINVRAQYHQLGEFISRLERSPDFNRIDNLSISGGGSGSDQNIRLVVSRISLLKKEKENE